MIKYCKIIDEEKGLVQLGAGCPDEYYQEIGMKQRDVQQSDIDGQWYLAELCPMKTEEQKTEERANQFYTDFFNVEGFGWYRRNPKGYQSAVESMNVLFNIANITKGLQAGLIIFYQKPDFSKPEQCTEEWLVQHQIVMPAMTLEDFLQLYVAFMTAWNTEEHIKETSENSDNIEEAEEL